MSVHNYWLVLPAKTIGSEANATSTMLKCYLKWYLNCSTSLLFSTVVSDTLLKIFICLLVAEVWVL